MPFHWNADHWDFSEGAGHAFSQIVCSLKEVFFSSPADAVGNESVEGVARAA
jgi:hypothetical protein